MQVKLYTILMLLGLSGCSYLNLLFETDEKLVIDTKPTKAKVYTVEGKEVGQTPLMLGKAESSSLRDEDFFYLVVKKPGHLDQLIVVPANGIDNYTVKLFAYNQEHFSRWVLDAYGERTNQLIRELLKIQGLLLQKKYQSAQKRLLAFQGSFPGVAASYTMLGNIHFINKQYEEAQAQFLRAISIDPQDQTATRFLAVVRKILE
ncbi:MAG: tetratricopeptide repeat protein [Bdellovibrionales bacterium]|jgi:tetratricopeptide (TPR) repeat protein|nr:tetratricopeptide repeat protein [Bdellovibrionales bacterium]MBT3526121.1 tetratricopeptide repeat protein [Bdellovibrionales bacterium]MBT7669593.1 tetratricopeptide repeat protein [Bdellovibrionales bacterium]MBT7767312.1 tetratricopeptide repeat protein [Bdellovibrionales bacterium]